MDLDEWLRHYRYEIRVTLSRPDLTSRDDTFYCATLDAFVRYTVSGYTNFHALTVTVVAIRDCGSPWIVFDAVACRALEARVALAKLKYEVG